jgi:hypothetical protein
VVARRLGRRATDAEPPEQVGLIRAGILPGGVVEHLADSDALAEQLGTGGLNIGDDQVKALGRARRRGGDVFAEDDRTAGAGRRELNNAKVVAAVEISIEAPAELRVELLGAVHIRDGNDHDLEPQVDVGQAAPFFMSPEL